MPHKKTFFYFAYGSNLKLSEIHRSCPTAGRQCMAKLPDHALVFSRKSIGRSCGVASVTARAGSEVWGGVYEISEVERETLESREGFKPNRPPSANAYVPAVLTVLVDGDPTKSLEAITFIANSQSNPPLPSLDYKSLIIDGAREWNLDAAYIARLEQTKTSKPMTYKKKLIEVALPLEDINREATRENFIYKGNPSAIHKWWAQRPLAACRAVLFSSLVDDPSECVTELMADAAKRRAAEKALAAQRKLWEARKALFDKAQAAKISAPAPGAEPKLEEIIVETERERLFDIIRELVKWENSNDERVINKVRAEILRSTGGNPPPVYDPFCGGGSIPLEAQRLGLKAHASDLNPVPVLINKALIEIPPRFAAKPPVNQESRKKLSASGSWKGAAGLAGDIRY